MVVKAVYDNGYEEEIEDYTYPNVQLTQGQTAVTLSYTYNSKTVTVNVPITVEPQRAVYGKYTVISTPTKSWSMEWIGTGGVTTMSGSSRMYEDFDVDLNTGKAYLTGSMHTIREAFDYGYNMFQLNSSKDVVKQFSPFEQTGSNYRCNVDMHRINITNINVDSMGTYISDVTANANSLPANGRHTDGYWYVLKNLIAE